MCVDADGGQRVLDLLELELQPTLNPLTRMVGTRLESSERGRSGVITAETLLQP